MPGYHWFAAEGSSLNIQNSEITQVHGFTVDQDEFTLQNHEGSVQFYGVRSWFRNSPANSYHDGRSLFHFDSGDPQDDNFDGLSLHIEKKNFTFEEGATYGLQNIETGSWSGKKEIHVTFSDDKGNFGLPPSASDRSNSQITIMHSTLPDFWEEEYDWLEIRNGKIDYPYNADGTISWDLGGPTITFYFKNLLLLMFVHGQLKSRKSMIQCLVKIEARCKDAARVRGCVLEELNWH